MIRSYQLTRQVQIKQIMYRVHPITAIRPHIGYISISRALLQIYVVYYFSRIMLEFLDLASHLQAQGELRHSIL